MVERKLAQQKIMQVQSVADPLRAAAPPPTAVTPALIDAARKEGRVVYRNPFRG